MAVSNLDAGRRPGRHDARRGQGARAADEQVRALREGTSTTRRRETPALFAAEEKPQRTRNSNDPKARGALPLEHWQERQDLRRSNRPSARRMREAGTKGTRARRLRSKSTMTYRCPAEPPKDVVTRVVMARVPLLRDGDVRVHVERHYREAPRGAQARRAGLGGSVAAAGGRGGACRGLDAEDGRGTRATRASTVAVIGARHTE